MGIFSKGEVLEAVSLAINELGWEYGDGVSQAMRVLCSGDGEHNVFNKQSNSTAAAVVGDSVVFCTKDGRQYRLSIEEV